MSDFKFQISNVRSSRGVALVIVLAMLVLVLGLCIAFLSRVSTERSSSQGNASAAFARLLGDTAVQIAQGQIDAAVTGTNAAQTAWSSQPGLIRTFDNSGNPLKSYKLYSSGTMQVSGALKPLDEVSSLSQWYNSPAIYTDLNAPVSIVSVSGTTTTWPILDPTSFLTGSNAPQGFNINNAPTGSYQGVTNSAPMPVNWLYMLKDGTVVAPTAVNSITASVAGASAANPIVGRIAFWTDDETCKVNINTASEGEYWDVPHFHNAVDQNFGISQPVKNEFQGYPGHPAGISLSTIFPNLVSGSQATEYDPFYAIAPRIQSGGSLNGTVTSSTNSKPVTLDQDRLYDNVDELLFSSTSSGTLRQVNPQISGSPQLSRTDIDKAKFFITAHSRAPETNLFNQPKIACWPIHTDAINHRSAFDKIIAFCSTINQQPYYFQRENKDSTTEDYNNIQRNQNLYSYLQTLTGMNVPGFGGNLATKFGVDRDQILTEIFDYIRCTNLNDLNLSSTSYQYAPGVTASNYGQAEVAPITTGSTRGFGRFLTVTEAGLWLVCTADPTVASTPASNDVTNLTLAPDPVHSGKGLLLTKDDVAKTKQLRIEAALILDPFTPMLGAAPMHADIEILVSGLENWTIQGDSDGAVTNFGFPSQFQQTYTGAGVFELGFRGSYMNSTFNMGGFMGADWALCNRQVRARNSGRLPRDAQFASGHIDADSSVLDLQYPFVSEPVTVNVKQTGPTLTFSGGLITVTIRQRTTGTIIQTLNLNFPQTSLPAPTLATGTSANYPNMADNWTFQAGGCGVNGTKTGRLLSWRATPLPAGPPNTGPNVDATADVIYSIVAAQNNQTLDPRFIAMTGTDSGKLFSTHPYYDGTHKSADSLISNPINGLAYNASGVGNTGTLANLGAGKFYPTRFWPCPKVPWPATAAVNNGDWDNGVGDLPDGGYLNEPDQGNIASSYSTPYYTTGNVANAVFTSPSRMIPSPGMFGSLPTTFARSQAAGFNGAGHQGWQTLLFRRQPGHPDYTATPGGFTSDPDYLMMDLFWMPVVEPYAISEPLSTAGKINMNYQIVPFTYLERSTGLYSILKHEKVISVPTSDYNKIYKSASTFGNQNYRRDVKIPETLTQFQQRFDNSDNTGLYAFRTPAEICDVHFIPDDASPNTSSKAALDADMASYWTNHSLTGDNCRERIYTTVYPRLTTKSNTYTVHFRAQALKQALGTNMGQWIEGKDIVTAEYRGSTTIDRYIDPNNSSIPDYATTSGGASLDTFYHWRVCGHHQFAP